MLKIKDNVDLKELEKFGFYLDSDEWYVKDIKSIYIFVKPISREIVIKAYNTSNYAKVDTIYDLIQAGLVEKVSD